MKINLLVTSFANHLDEQYGKPGTPAREEFEEDFEAFKLGSMLQKPSREKGLAKPATH
jgi:HTH-type transcriptional regulator/antitoxin HipB